MDPAALEIADIAKTHHCPLARVVRGRLHKLGIDRGFTAVFSAEPVREGSVIQCDEQNKRSNLGTISYTPAMFGIEPRDDFLYAGDVRHRLCVGGPPRAYRGVSGKINL